VHNENLEAELLLKPSGEILRFGNRRHLANEDSPENGIAGTCDKLGRSVFFGELSPEVFGVLMDRISTDLDAVEVAECQRSARCSREPALYDVRIGMRRGDYFKPDRSDTWPQQFDLAGSGFGKIDDASVHKRSTVGNAYVYGKTIGRVRYTDPGVERHGAMSSGQLFHVIYLAVSGLTSVIRRSIPTGKTFLCGADRRGNGGCGM
jgi:hypothetical protein